MKNNDGQMPMTVMGSSVMSTYHRFNVRSNNGRRGGGNSDLLAAVLRTARCTAGGIGTGIVAIASLRRTLDPAAPTSIAPYTFLMELVFGVPLCGRRNDGSGGGLFTLRAARTVALSTAIPVVG